MYLISLFAFCKETYRKIYLLPVPSRCHHLPRDTSLSRCSNQQQHNLTRTSWTSRPRRTKILIFTPNADDDVCHDVPVASGHSDRRQKIHFRRRPSILSQRKHAGCNAHSVVSIEKCTRSEGSRARVLLQRIFRGCDKVRSSDRGNGQHV